MIKYFKCVCGSTWFNMSLYVSGRVSNRIKCAKCGKIKWVKV